MSQRQKQPIFGRAITAVIGHGFFEAGDRLAVVPCTVEHRQGGHNDRAYAAGKLGAMGDAARPALPRLIHALKDETHGSPWAAATALGNLGAIAENAIPQLLANVRERRAVEPAALALWRIAEHPEAIPALTKLVQHEDHGQRRRAIQVLGEIGPAAQVGHSRAWRAAGGA